MSIRERIAVAAAVLSLAPAAGWAAKLDNDAKRWLAEVRPIMLPDEEKTYRDLKDKGEREGFQKIFWARRDPNLDTPENEFQAEYMKSRAEADAQFRAAGRPGSETDCGRVFLLLGKPDEMKAEPVGENPTARPPETWTYRDRPGQTFVGGEAKIQFAGNCELPQGNRLGEQLARVAESKVLQPNIGYKRTPDGKLVPLADQLPKPSPSQTLLKAPRQDFPLAAEQTLFLKTEDGATYVAGLLRADAAGFPVTDVGGKKMTKVVVAAQAVDATGRVTGNIERQVTVEVGTENAVEASYGMALKPGEYTLKVAALEPTTGKGSLVSVPVKAPDFGAGELFISPLVVLQDFQETSAARDPADPLADFAMAGARLVPRFGNTFAKTDSITVLAQIYAPKVDEATGKPSIGSVYTISRDGKPIAKAEEQTSMMAAVGPVPLANYPPGKYTVELKVTDKVAKKDFTRETTFEIK